MKKAGIMLVILFVVLSFFSCRNEVDLERNFPIPSTWGELFDIFHSKMSTNYLFWSLDYNEGRDWDSVYGEYKPLFDELGAIEEGRTEDAQKANSNKAFEYFFDILKVLHDGHFSISFNDGNGAEANHYSFSPSTYRILKSLGVSDEDVFEAFLMTREEREEKYPGYYNLQEENTANIANYVFRVDISKVDGYQSEINGTGTYSSSTFSVLKIDGSSPVVGITGILPNDIAYLSFSGFEFVTNVGTQGEAIENFLTDFSDNITTAGIQGVIVDLRGNGGGATADLKILWPEFFTDDMDSVHAADTRRKKSEGRTDYTAWVPFEICKDGDRTSNYDNRVPIAVLINENSCSCAEMSTMLFKALGDEHGYTVRVFGTNSMGGTGMLYYDDRKEQSEIYFNGGITKIEPYVDLIYTPFCQLRAYDGVIYEGVGITPDEIVPFNYDNFTKGTDARLDAAITWLTTI